MQQSKQYLNLSLSAALSVNNLSFYETVKRTTSVSVNCLKIDVKEV